MRREIFEPIAARLIAAVAPGKNVEWFTDTIEAWREAVARYNPNVAPTMVVEAVRQMSAELQELPTASMFNRYVNDVIEDEERAARRRREEAEDRERAALPPPDPFAASPEEATATLEAIRQAGAESLKRCITSGVWDRSYARSATLQRMRKQAAATAAQNMISDEVRAHVGGMTGPQIKKLRQDAMLYAGQFAARIRAQDVTDEMIDATLQSMASGAIKPPLRGTLEAALAARLPPLVEW